MRIAQEHEDVNMRTAFRRFTLIVGGLVAVVAMAACGDSVVVEPTTTTEGKPPVLTPRSTDADSMTPTMGTSTTDVAGPKA